MAYIDISTDRAVTSRSFPLDELEHELTRVSPVEIVLPSGVKERMQAGEGQVVRALQALLKGSGVIVSYVDAPPQKDREQQAITCINNYLTSCLMDDMPVLLPPNHQEPSQTLRIDASTLLGLEVRHSLNRSTTTGTSRAGTLLSVIRRTLTASGTRLLVNTLTQPSADLGTITRRHALVHAFVERAALREDLRDFLREQAKNGGEIVRIVQRFSASRRKNGRLAARYYGAGFGNARDLVDLREQVESVRWLVERVKEEVVRETTKTERTERLRDLVQSHRDLQVLVDVIDGAVERGALEKVEEVDGEEEEPRERANGVWWLKPE